MVGVRLGGAPAHGQSRRRGHGCRWRSQVVPAVPLASACAKAIAQFGPQPLDVVEHGEELGFSRRRLRRSLRPGTADDEAPAGLPAQRRHEVAQLGVGIVDLTGEPERFHAERKSSPQAGRRPTGSSPDCGTCGTGRRCGWAALSSASRPPAGRDRRPLPFGVAMRRSVRAPTPRPRRLLSASRSPSHAPCRCRARS